MKLKPAILALAAASFGLSASDSQTTLSVGDLSFISAEADANGSVTDGYSIVTWQSLAAGTVLKFTDNGMSNAAATAANTTEHAWTFTVGATSIAAGTTLNFGFDSPTTGKWNGPVSGTTSANLAGFINAGISTSGDQLFVYQGTGTGANTATTPAGAGAFTGTLVSGINFGPTITSGTPNSNNTYAPTSLVNGDAYVNGGNFDNGYYSGVRTGLSNTLYRAATHNLTNFAFTETLNASYDRTTSFTIATAASIHWDANGATANNGGTGTWDVTTNDRFKNSAAGTTYTRWVNSSTGNDHTAVFGGTAGTVTVSGGVIASGLQFDTASYTLTASTITLSGSATPVIATGTLSATINSTLAGTQGFAKTGTGTLTLGGANTYTGDTAINNGILQLTTGNDRLPTGTVVFLGQATSANLGTLDLNARNQQIAGLTSSSGTNATASNNTVTSTAAATLTINTAGSNSYTYGDGTNANSGVITGAISLVKSGAGTQILGDANTYTGTTTLNAGKLVVTNSIGSSAVTVSGSGAILASDTAATLGSTLTIQSGAILAVGDAANASTATATVTGVSTFNNGSIFSWDINSAGTSYDKLISSSIAGESTAGDAVFRIVAADATFADAFWNQNRTWSDIFTTDGSSPIADWAGIFGSTVSVVNSSFTTITPVGGSFTVSGNSLSWSAVPEPSSALAGILLGAGLLRRRRVA
ncbi:autotransporter-associated beta strand repeat-containing protein [bacterium]|nr:autotransporter-associated beta strand repeat-containing protein [bacterium]